MLLHRDLTEKIIGAAVEVHKELGPGLLEGAYEECLCHELKIRELCFVRQVPIPLSYKGVSLDCGYRVDLIVEEKVLLELKAVDQMLPVFEAQLMTYLKLSKLRLGILMNFCAPTMKEGILRRVL